MDQEFRDAFVSLSGQLSDMRSEMIARMEKNEKATADLRRDVFGTSEPPKMNGSNGTSPVPLAKLASGASLEVEAHESRIINVEKKVDDLALATKAQSDFMGIGKKGLEWLRSKEAKSDILRIVTLVAAGYAALHSAGVFK